jgi:hypothetical protein
MNTYIIHRSNTKDTVTIEDCFVKTEGDYTIFYRDVGILRETLAIFTKSSYEYLYLLETQKPKGEV